MNGRYLASGYALTGLLAKATRASAMLFVSASSRGDSLQRVIYIILQWLRFSPNSFRDLPGTSSFRIRLLRRAAGAICFYNWRRHVLRLRLSACAVRIRCFGHRALGRNSISFNAVVANASGDDNRAYHAATSPKIQADNLLLPPSFHLLASAEASEVRRTCSSHLAILLLSGVSGGGDRALWRAGSGSFSSSDAQPSGGIGDVRSLAVSRRRPRGIGDLGSEAV
jgi:hypothetical protein